MAELPDALRDDPQTAVAFITTEHFNLASSRSGTISETNGRASVFLGSVSAGLVAVAFAGQTSRTALYTLGLVLFPVLFFLGVVTFERALQASIDDTHFMLRINRIRRFYLEASPGLARYMARPAASEQVADVLRTEAFGSRWQLLLSIVGALAVINSVLLGVTAGFLVAALTGGELWAATPVGLVAFAISVPLHQRYQSSRRARAHSVDLFEHAA